MKITADRRPPGPGPLCSHGLLERALTVTPTLPLPPGATLHHRSLSLAGEEKRGSSRSMVLLEHLHANCSGCNPLACGYSMGRRKPAFWLEVGPLARMVHEPLDTLRTSWRGIHPHLQQ
uniref:Heat shock factor-binding protein 1-like protein 1 isoform X2 n=1 Tax=Callorhinus ursinus TaxID=34884 RepID=A0A3Q7N458_CALUR|nr:heat shock factor-binding protein 1-like protein 1 isoform X2 [Callorhinus ursinus]